MDHSETPENDDFRDREFDCFLEKKKATGKGRGGGLLLTGKSREKPFSLYSYLQYLQHIHGGFYCILLPTGMIVRLL